MSEISDYFQVAQSKGWLKKPGKTFLSEVNERSEDGKEEILGLSKERGVLLRSEIGQRSAEAETYKGYKVVCKGQLISNKMQAWNGMFGISPHDGITSPDYAIYNISDGVDHRFVEAILRTPLYAVEFKARSRGMGTGFLRLNPEQLLTTPFWMPPKLEQTAIADFIERECGRMDKLVEKKQQFIALLKEKRQALITHAVTKGLNPKAKMKDSAVEWLGMVPEHWEVKRLGFFFVERKEKVSDTDFAALSVTKSGIVPQMEHVAKTDDNDNRRLVRKGDFVINSRSDRKGSSGLSLLDGSVSLINIVITPNSKISGYFCHHLLRSYAFQEEFYRYGTGIVADLWSTKYSEMKNILLPLPPLAEQTAIADFLDQQTSRIDTLIAKTEKSIDLLKERKTALITAAVTGQIDVTQSA